MSLQRIVIKDNSPINLKKLVDTYGGYWGECPAYPVVDWLYEVNNGDTRRGYWEWVVANADEGELPAGALPTCPS
jgi:hypothetical protein